MTGCATVSGPPGSASQSENALSSIFDSPNPCSNESGGLSGKPFPAPKTIQNILAINTAVLADLENGTPVTPTFVVKTSDGLALHEGFIDA